MLFSIPRPQVSLIEVEPIFPPCTVFTQAQSSAVPFPLSFPLNLNHLRTKKNQQPYKHTRTHTLSLQFTHQNSWRTTISYSMANNLSENRHFQLVFVASLQRSPCPQFHSVACHPPYTPAACVLMNAFQYTI